MKINRFILDEIMRIMTGNGGDMTTNDIREACEPLFQSLGWDRVPVYTVKNHLTHLHREGRVAGYMTKPVKKVKKGAGNTGGTYLWSLDMEKDAAVVRAAKRLSKLRSKMPDLPDALLVRMGFAVREPDHKTHKDAKTLRVIKEMNIPNSTGLLPDRSMTFGVSTIYGHG